MQIVGFPIRRLISDAHLNLHVTVYFLCHSHDYKQREDICFFEVKTKYISSELKTSEFSRVRSTSENFAVFNSRDDYVFGIHRKKANFLFILYF